MPPTPAPMPPSTPEPPPPEISLADWRRRVSELYAEVRRIAATDPRRAHAAWRETRERLFREHPQSPVPTADRAAFRALDFTYDPALRFEVVVEPRHGEPDREERGAPDGASPTGFADGRSMGEAPHVGGPLIRLPNSGDDEVRSRRIGRVVVPFADGPRTLSLFWLEGYAGGLFLPFRDATNGLETYGAGRYLIDAAKGADLGPGRAPGTLVLDFNFAFQPSCAFDPRWACPLAPPENRLDVPVRAGERIA